MSGSACRSCGAPLLWALTVKNRRIPLDPTPIEVGRRGAMVLVDDQWAYTPDDLAQRIAEKLNVDLAKAHDHLVARYPAHTSHFATCPDAPRHRRNRR